MFKETIAKDRLLHGKQCHLKALFRKSEYFILCSELRAPIYFMKSFGHLFLSLVSTTTEMKSDYSLKYGL